MRHGEENIMVILSSPSGVGKTTLTKKIQQKYQNFKLSVSHTTRSPRSNEVDGVDYMTEFVDDMVQYWDDNLTKLFRKKRDIQIADAVIELFKRRGDLENFNKKALYIMIREMTDVKTQHITKVVNTMKSHYLKISENYYQTGSFSGKKIDISSLF